MLAIREEQVEVFRQVALENFENDMVTHSKEFTPGLCKVLGDEQLRVVLRQAIQQAESYGFTNKGPVRLYIELMFLFGSDFDTDPQYPALGEILNTFDNQMIGAEQIYEWIIDYQSKVSGPENINTTNAIEALANFARKRVTFTPSNFEATILEEMNHAFPKKVAYIGKEALTKLINEGRAEAQRHSFPLLRGEALIAILMFALGRGCTNDPIYPWISRILTDSRIGGPEDRFQQLAQKTLMWFDYVLNKFEEEERV